MPRRVTTAPAAAIAFRDARQWLMQPGSGAAGAKRWDALKQARNSLRNYPYLGGISEHHPGHRRHVVSGYRIGYQIRPDTGDTATAGDIRIVALFGPGEK